MKKVILTLVAGCALCSTAMAANYETTQGPVNTTTILAPNVIRSLSQAQKYCAPVKNIRFSRKNRGEGVLFGRNRDGVNFVSFNDVRNGRAVVPSVNVIAPRSASKLARNLKLYRNSKLNGYGVRLPNGVIHCLYQYRTANTGARVTVMMVGNGRPQA